MGAAGGRTVAIIQARLGSTRLPGKVLQDLAGEPMLARVVERLGRARTLDDIWIATTTEPRDDALVELCLRRGWPCARGSESDVLDRYVRAARESRAERVVRITSDCPLIDAAIVDRVVDALGPTSAYSSNLFPVRTFPRGLDTEAFTVAALETAGSEATAHPDREHVTPYIWRQPDRFPQASVSAESDHSHERWTVDTPEDYQLVQKIYAHFGDAAFGWQDVLRLLDTHPSWRALNAGVQQRAI